MCLDVVDKFKKCVTNHVLDVNVFVKNGMPRAFIWLLIVKDKTGRNLNGTDKIDTTVTFVSSQFLMST